MLVDGWLICYRTQHYPKIELPHWFPSGQSPYRESLAYQLIEPGWNQFLYRYAKNILNAVNLRFKARSLFVY